ncbi:MAG: hypothetical protein CVU57_00685 [Deltaproteobacteria bacterium HGW-Deltaproteobacteria-15]|jgi:hypothetical protein|nr:MAG: hypothetical protein CVU57_00685 [Deltaproteobacteria bacterium HGW-Deltaproteobacteria-15]
MLRHFLQKTTFLFLANIILFLPAGYCHGRTLVPLQKEDVFCLYFKLSGQPMGDQDIEDLCFAQGRPIYSSFKPAEMFLTPTIKAMRARLLKRMKEYGNGSLFVWKFEAAIKKERSGRSLGWASEPPEQMPHATPFIRAAFSEKEWKHIEESAQALLEAKPSLGHGPVEITIQAKPLGVDQLPERRIVAQEELKIPIRFILFQSVDIQISQAGEHRRDGLQKRIGQGTSPNGTTLASNEK